jgi:hypothetical protein
MLEENPILPDDPEELRGFTARLLAEVKAQAILIEKLRHQLAGHRAHRFGASSETADQLQLTLETSEIAAAAMTARMKLPDIEEKDKPKRRPIPDHIPRMEVELTPGAEACADCGGRLRRIGEDVTEELEYVPGRFIVNRIVRPRLTCSCCERFVQGYGTGAELATFGKNGGQVHAVDQGWEEVLTRLVALLVVILAQTKATACFNHARSVPARSVDVGPRVTVGGQG